MNRLFFSLLVTILSFTVYSSSYCGVPCNNNSDCNDNEECSGGVCVDKKQTVPESSTLMGILLVGGLGMIVYLKNKYNR
jgi:hypothetical protein